MSVRAEPPPDGLVAVVKRACPTCNLVEPVLRRLAGGTAGLAVLSQDDPRYPAGVGPVIDDSGLERSFRLDIEIVPTLIRREGGREIGRVIGWNRADWRALTGVADLGEGLPENRPGCGARNVEPGIAEELARRLGDNSLRSRRIVLGPGEDEMEACYERGWSDGLPLVPPTEDRVLRMLGGTRRAGDEAIGVLPPDYAPCTVEKVAINAVMAGCKPEYLPVVLAAVEAALIWDFSLHGVVATTDFPGPVVIVNGPIAKRIGMNSGLNALGQGNRANAAIGRALQLVIRNVGGGRPGGVDRATLGSPGKYTFCFAENEEGTSWEPLSAMRGFAPGRSVVTLFAGSGPQPIHDNASRHPESLALGFAACLSTVLHPKLARGDAFLVVAPEHSRVFERAGWSKVRLLEELDRLLRFPGPEMARGAGGMAEGVPAEQLKDVVAKFRPGGLSIVRAGSNAGFFSAIITGYAGSGPTGSQPVSKEVEA